MRRTSRGMGMRGRRKGRWLLVVAGLMVAIGLYAAHLVGLLGPEPFSVDGSPLAVPQQLGLAPHVVGPPVPEPPPHGKVQGLETSSPPPGRVNLLLMGIDAREEGQQTRADALMLLSLVPSKRELSILTIPRDSRVAIPGHGLDKINHAHAFGGIPLSLQTVADLLQVPIHYYIRIDMPNFLKLIDQVGPVTVQVPYGLTLRDGTELTPGEWSMGSELALIYLRERFNDPTGDFGRGERAQGFLLDLARQVKKEASLTDLPALYGLFVRHVETDLGLRESLSLVRLYWGLEGTEIQQGALQGDGAMIDGIYYFEIDWSRTGEVLQELGIWTENQP